MNPRTQKLILYLLLALIAIAFSCAPNRNITAWRCVGQYKVINGVGHDFVSLSGRYGKTIDVDTAICNIGDTIKIKDYKRFALLSK